MTKMFGLMQNEFIKTFKKLSTKILCVLIILVCIGFCGLAKISQKINENYNYDSVSEIDYDYEIQRLKELKYEGWEQHIEAMEFMKTLNVGYTSWRYNAINNTFGFETDDDGEIVYIYSDEQRENLKKFISDNDWEKYCEFKLSDTSKYQLSEGERWEYEYRLKNNVPLIDNDRDYENWKNTTIRDVSYAKDSLNYGGEDVREMEAIEKIGLYRLENNISVNVSDYLSGNVVAYNCWMVLGISPSIVLIVGLFVMIIAGSIVSNEYSQGTIKFLIINPVKRWKILVAKYFTCILTGFGFVVLFYLGTIVSSGLFFGFGDMNAQYIDYVNGKIVATAGLWYIFKSILVNSVNILVMATLAFALSSLVRSSSLAIGVSVFSLLAGNTVVSIPAGFNIDWARYLIFANTDLMKISQGGSPFQNHTVPFAVGVIIAHMAVFLLTAWDGFTKREI